MSDKTKRDIVSTGVLGAVGGAEGLAMAKILPKIPSKVGKFGVAAGATLGLDYAGLKIARGIHKATGISENKND